MKSLYNLLNISLLPILSTLLLFSQPLHANQHLLVGIYDNAPLVYKDDQGGYSGLSIEVLEYIASKENWDLEYLHGTWPECIDRLKKGEIDLQILIGYTKERDKIYDYTKESLFVAWGQVYTSPEVSAVSILDLQDMTIALYKGSLLSEVFKDLLEKFEIKSNLVEVENYVAIAELIKSGEADAGVFNRTFAGQYGKKTDFIKTPIVFSPIPLYYAAPENKHGEILKAIDNHLQELKSNQDSLYYHAVEKTVGGIQIKRFPWWTKWLLLGVTSLTLIIFFLNILLKRQVDRKTKELQSQNILLEQEIADRKKAEEELLKWGHIFKVAKWGIALSSGQGATIDLINPAYAEMHGYTVSELEYQEISSVFAPNFRNKLPEIIQLCHKHGHYTFEGDHIRKDGSTFPAYHDVTTIKDETDQVIYQILGVLDISDRKQAEKEKANLESQLIQAHKMEAIGTLAGGIAHDFNNILAAILGYTELARDSTPANSPAREHLAEVINASIRAAELVKHILAFSRKEDGERSLVHIHQVAEEALKLLRATIPVTIDIKKNIDNSSGSILADPTQILQVFMNLCTNSAQAMEETGGTLEVSVSPVHLSEDALRNEPHLEPGRYVQISVFDTGGGIESKNLDRIFDPYFTTKTAGNGSGMGLAIVMGIVKSHNGMLKVESSPEAGTRFSIYFRKVEQQLPQDLEEETHLPLGESNILIVDDEKSILDMTVRRVRSLGYQVTGVNNSVEALQLFKANADQFDLVITDQTMPELTGEKLVRALKKIRADLPVIVCTGYSSTLNAEKAQLAGIDAFLMKPVNKKQLAKTINKMLESHSS